MARDLPRDDSVVQLNRIDLHISRYGQGSPVLLLHPEIGIAADAPLLRLLGQGAQVIVPTHPGFGQTNAPHWVTTVADLAYCYLDLLDCLDLTDVTLVGLGFGGWIAAEIAVRSTARLSRLVLGNAVGIKPGDHLTRDIADIFAMTSEEIARAAYFDPDAARRDYATMPESELIAIARNREATARFGWSPYMHNPKLLRRLHRIKIPTTVLWGMSDQIVAPDYGRAYAAAIPGARFEPVKRAGHYPHEEQPEAVARCILAMITAGADS